MYGDFTTQEIIAGTLEWCNDHRAGKGLEPLDDLPKGLLMDPASCPCGLATGLYVETTTWGPTRETKSCNPLPKVVTAFVVRFDNKELPQYVDEADECP